MEKIKINSKLSKFDLGMNTSKFTKCNVLIAHDKLNLNNSWFEIDTLLNGAKKSLGGSPVLANVFKDNEGVYRIGGHDMVYDFIDTENGIDIDVFYEEKPIGFFPQDCEIEVVEIDDKSYISSDCLIWKNYASQVLGVMERNNQELSVSMEIECLDSHMREDNVVVINDFNFLGVTVLGEGIQPAMSGSHIRYSMADIKHELEEMIKAYSLEKEVDNMENEEIVVEEVDETVETTEESQEIIEEFEEQIEEEVIETEVEVEEVQEPTEFELLQGKHETVVAEFEELKEKYAELESKLNSMGDYEELKEFKDAYDTAKYEQEVNEITSMFDCLDEEDVKELRSQVLAKEITKESYQEKLAYKQFMKEKSVKKNYSVDKTESSEISIFGESVEIKNRPYGGEFDKYLNK